MFSFGQNVKLLAKIPVSQTMEREGEILLLMGTRSSLLALNASL